MEQIDKPFAVRIAKKIDVRFETLERAAEFCRGFNHASAIEEGVSPDNKNSYYGRGVLFHHKVKMFYEKNWGGFLSRYLSAEVIDDDGKSLGRIAFKKKEQKCNKGLSQLLSDLPIPKH